MERETDKDKRRLCRNPAVKLGIGVSLYMWLVEIVFVVIAFAVVLMR
jgi:hypothetical protein